MTKLSTDREILEAIYAEYAAAYRQMQLDDSGNPDYAGDPTATISYRLVNGQEDSYPASWALPIATVESALQHFRATGERPPFVVWHDDSL